MTPNEYQKLAMRTAPKDLCPNDLAINAALGLTGECGEFADLVKKYMYQGHPLDSEHAKKELGDILWYVAMGCMALGTSIETVMELNIEKLKARYPEGFNSNRSMCREEGDI